MPQSPQADDSKQEKRKGFGCLVAIGMLIAAVVIFGIIGSIFEGPKSNLVEMSLTPVIDALEKYKAANGRYPDKLDALVPTYLSPMPNCPDSSKPGAAYFLDAASGEYVLGCYTTLFMKRLYSSRSKKWETSD